MVALRTVVCRLFSFSLQMTAMLSTKKREREGTGDVEDAEAQLAKKRARKEKKRRDTELTLTGMSGCVGGFNPDRRVANHRSAALTSASGVVLDANT